MCESCRRLPVRGECNCAACTSRAQEERKNMAALQEHLNKVALEIVGPPPQRTSQPAPKEEY